MGLEYFAAYHSYRQAIDPLNDAERGRLFTACLDYSMTGAEPELRGNERFIFPLIRSQIDRDAERYAEKCRMQSRNASMRWHTTASDGIPTDANDAKTKTKTKTKTNSPSEGNARESKRSRFVAPSVEDVSAYCQERGNAVDANTFVDFYASKGWCIGNQPMKDWRAAVRTWEKRDAADPRKIGRNYPQHKRTDDELKHLYVDLDKPLPEED